MFPFWDSVIAPIIRASGGRRIVEIGALRGENTVKMLEDMDASTELHVIDPVPEFDPAVHQGQFPGRYVFHRGLSLDVLPNCPPFDVALVDGDHNWYTVYNELKQLSEVARKADAPLPILFLHDVGWPYGYRDLYYNPDTVPVEFQQPHSMKGMRPGYKGLLPKRGLNNLHYNANVEGGPRNGVMRAFQDFVQEYDRELKVIVIPIYYGLAIAIEQQLIDANPELEAVLKGIQSPKGQRGLLELSEEIRLDQQLFTHNAFAIKDAMADHATTRYLDLLKGALLNEHYLEYEVRLSYVLDSALNGRFVGAKALRDPVRHLRNQWRRASTDRAVGRVGDAEGVDAFFPYTDVGRTRLDQIERAMDAVDAERIPGDLVDVSVGRGGVGIFLRGYVDVHKEDVLRPAGRKVWVVDEFRSSPALEVRELDQERPVADLRADVNMVREGFEKFGLLDPDVRFVQGEIVHALQDPPMGEIALLRVGRGLGAGVADVLDRLYDRVAPGGFVIIEDHHDEAVSQAVADFRHRREISAVLEQVDWSAASWRRAANDATEDVPELEGPLNTIPLVPPATEPCDLSVIVVFYNMKREAARTLRSLTRHYQIEVDDLDYEVIVIENGSAPEEKLGAEYVAAFGPEFRYVDLGDEATPTPTDALNKGLALSRGTRIALMIDGAHVLSPGVLRHGVSGLETYDPAIVAVQQWYVGPGQQGDAMNHGYDQKVEDGLFERIAWPTDGYRLFEIGHFIGDRDWFDGMQESNCLFAPRALLEQVGGFDNSFSMPGGGYANLDLWERLAESPGVKMCSILGEGSFHQFHGGTTTNQSDDEFRRGRVFSYGAHYEETRGRTFHGPGKPIHYVGGLKVQAARRTRARRMSTEMFSPSPAAHGRDGMPDHPIPIPDELTTAFTEAYWYNLAWRQSTWMGKKVRKAPTDLIAYQELIFKVRPDWIIETGAGSGGRALFLATMCDLVGHGQVLSVDRNAPDDVVHPRLTFLRAQPHRPANRRQIDAIVGENPRALVILGSRGKMRQMIGEFNQLAPLVPKGSYVIMEDTVVNGRPVWPGFGAGPREAVNQLLVVHGEFAPDHTPERFGFTLNAGGYLKRVK